MTLILFKLALLFYLLGTVGYVIYLVSQKKPLAYYAYGVLWAGFLAHSLAIGGLYYQTGFFPVHNLRESLSFFAWAIIGAYLVIQIRFNIRVLGSFLSPLAVVMMISSSFLPHPTGPANPLRAQFLAGVACGNHLSRQRDLRHRLPGRDHVPDSGKADQVQASGRPLSTVSLHWKRWTG